MKKIKQIVLIGTFSFLLVSSLPSVALAVWYNPITWFKSSPATESVVVEERSAPTAVTTTSATDTPEPIVQYVEKPVIKEVVKTVTQTVEDPAVRQQLNDTLAKNTQLTNQVLQYQNLIKGYEVANWQLNSKYADAVGVAAQCVAQLKSQPSYTPTPTIRCTSNTSTIDGTTFTICN